MLEALTLWLVEIHPALWHEGVWVGEDFGVDVEEYGCHTDDCLRGVRYTIGKRKSHNRFVSKHDTYSGWDLPLIIKQGTVTWYSLVAGNFARTKPVNQLF